jgi:hypothetical protein
LYFFYIAFPAIASLASLPFGVDLDTTDLDVSYEHPLPVSSISDEDLNSLYQKPVPQPTPEQPLPFSSISDEDLNSINPRPVPQPTPEQPLPFSKISDEHLSSLYQKPVPQPTPIVVQITTVVVVLPPEPPLEVFITTETTVSYMDSNTDQSQMASTSTH